jgi:asparagine synthase (glutamine-hydrolysing)
LSRSSFVAVAGDDARLEFCDERYVVQGFALGKRGPRAAIAHDEESCVVTLGELHAMADLARDLGLAPGAHDPAWLIMKAWQRWGADSLDRLLGSFAGAFLDLRRHRLVAFRDLTAAVPVYVTKVRGHFVAGSDLRTVAGWDGRPLEPSPLFVAGYLQNQNLDATGTAFDGVSCVQPGAIGVPSADGWRQKRVARWHVNPVRHRSLSDYVDDFAEHLDAAVARRMGGHSRAAVALSGGLDSTNVLAAGVRVAPHVEWVAYAIPFHTSRGDERSLQKVVAEHCGARLEWLSVQGRGPLGGWTGTLLGGRAAPPWAGNWFFGQTLAEGAASDGVPVLFDGEDADSLLTGGRGYLSDLLVRGQWRAWRREALVLRRTNNSNVRGLFKMSLAALLPPALAHRAVPLPPLARVSPLVAPGLAARVHLAERLRRQPALRLWAPGRRFTAQQSLAGEPTQLGMVAREVAEPYRDVDVVDAHPFFDRMLMTFCMGLPWQMVHGGTTPKLLLRELSRRRLPHVFNEHVRKANLSEYYDTAVFGVERDAVAAGLDLAEKRPEWVEPAGLARVRTDFEQHADSWMASRVAMLMLWADQLSG